MRTLQLLILLVLPAFGFAQSSLKVVVLLNKPDAGGMLRVALCPSVKAYKTDTGCVLKNIIVNGTTGTCTYTDIPPGTYAVKVFQDINQNGKLDTSWIGWPQEPYGFSNDASVNAGPPPFKLAAIQIRPGEQTSRIRLR